jgi:hypothetical protein
MIKKFILASVLIATSASSFAAGQVWDFSGSMGINNTGNGFVQTVTNGNGIDVKISAWSSTGDGCGTVYGNSLNDYDSCIESAKLKSWSTGLGVSNRDEDDGNNTPNHSIDNTNTIDNGRYADTNNNNHDIDTDMVLLTFDHAVKITGFGVGWVWDDFDSSVLAYTDTTEFTTFDGNSNWSDILSQGWELIDQNAVASTTAARDFAVDDQDVYSKHWLVGAFSRAFSQDTNWSDSNDAFKLSGLNVLQKPTDPNANPVSAPASVGIMLTLLAFMAYRRKS